MGNELRRREMLKGEATVKTYPFPAVNTSAYKVTNGNHVWLSSYLGQPTWLALSLGTYKISKNDPSIINNKQKLFTLHAGDEVSIVANMTSRNRVFNWKVGLRKANASVDVLTSVSDNTTQKTITATLQEDADVSTFYYWMASPGLNTTFEIDFEMYLNGVQIFKE